RLLEARLRGRFRGFGEAALLLVTIKDRAAILIAVIAELLIFRQRIDIVPKNIEQLLVGDFRWIEDDLNRLGMARPAVGNLLIGRIGGAPAGIARGCADHACDLVEVGLHTPETAAGESSKGRCRRLALLRSGGYRENEPTRHSKSDKPRHIPHDILPLAVAFNIVVSQS